jgi:hypothetical protein
MLIYGQKAGTFCFPDKSVLLTILLYGYIEEWQDVGDVSLPSVVGGHYCEVEEPG